MHRYKYLPLIVATLIGCGENSNVPPEHDAATLLDLSAVIDAGVVDLPAVDLAAVDLPVVIPDAAQVDSALPSCSAVDCPSPSPICDVAAGACRACNSDSDDSQCQTRSVATPHTGTCRGCVAHSECASTVCITDTGLCADTNDVAYIDNGGDSISDCKKINRVHDGAPAHPYCDIVDGVAAGNPYLRVTGHLGFPYSPLSFTASTNLIIVGPGAGVANPATISDSNIIDVQVDVAGTNSVTLILDGMELGTRATNTNNAGLFCSVSGGTASVTLRNGAVQHANNTGVSSFGCTLIISASNITNNGNGGLAISDGTATVSGSTFSNNSGAAAIHLGGMLTATFTGNTINGNTLAANTTAGVVVAGSTTTATLTGNTISGHGGDAVDCSAASKTTLIGNTISNNKQGVSSNASTLTLDSNRIFGSTGTGAFGVDVENVGNSTGKFVFNTVVENGGGGVDCGGGGTPKPLEASIVWGNQPAGGTQFPNNNCKLLETVTGTDSFSGAIQSTPTFVNPSPTPGPIDLHLQINTAANTACCIDKVGGQLDGGSPLPDHDIDSDHRPRGAGYDVGGDEAQ